MTLAVHLQHSCRLVVFFSYFGVALFAMRLALCIATFSMYQINYYLNMARKLNAQCTQ